MKKRTAVAWVYIIISLVLLGVVIWLQDSMFYYGNFMKEYGEFTRKIVTMSVVAVMSVTMFIIGVKELNLIVREQSRKENE